MKCSAGCGLASSSALRGLAGQILEGCGKGLVVVCGMKRIAEGYERDAG